MRYRTLVAILTVVFATAVPAFADVLAVVHDAQLAPGGSGYVDVTLSGANDAVQIAGFEFRISTTGAARMEFFNPQPTNYLGDPNYVLHGDSFDSTLSTPMVGGVGQTLVPGDTFIGSDSTASGADVTVGSDGLLTRLYVTAATSLLPQVGDSFTISLVPSDNTGFLDHLGNSISYSSVPGTVSIVVPEPGSFALLCVAGTLSLAWRLRRFVAKRNGDRVRGPRI